MDGEVMIVRVTPAAILAGRRYNGYAHSESGRRSRVDIKEREPTTLATIQPARLLAAVGTALRHDLGANDRGRRVPPNHKLGVVLIPTNPRCPDGNPDLIYAP